VAVRVTGLAFGRRADTAGDVVEALDIGFLRAKIQVATVGCDSPANASFRFCSVFVPFKFFMGTSETGPRLRGKDVFDFV